MASQTSRQEMADQEESFLSLFTKLSSVHLGQRKRCYVIQPKVDRDVHLHRLRRKAFDSLFSFLKSPESKTNGKAQNGLPLEVDGVLKYVFRMRRQGRLEEADRLEELFDSLKDGEDGVAAVLQLLVCLADTGEPQMPPPIGYDMYCPKLVVTDKKALPLSPERPLWTYYGDSMYPSYPFQAFELPSLNGGWYSFYPRSLFEPPSSRCIIEKAVEEERPFDIFQLTPGTGLRHNFFNPERDFRDDYDRESWLSLFGGLVNPRAITLDAKLEIPDLADDPHANPPEITIPKVLSLSELSEDGGFVSTEVSSSSATTPAESSGIEEDVWETALRTEPNRNYTWERIGLEPKCVHKDYLTSAGPQTVDELCRLQQHREHLLEPSSALPVGREVSPAQLVKDIVYLLVGIPSHTFPFNTEEYSFSIDPAVFTSGMSPAALQSFLADFVACGTCYQRLSAFSASQELDSLYTSGLVLQAFTDAVRSVLQYYQAAVLTIPKDVTLLSIHTHCLKVVRQMRFLAELCQCVDKKPDQDDNSFPLGVELISYLYEKTLAAVNTDNYLLMLSLLRTTCQPFVVFVQDWVFNGTFRDVYGEFMIQVNHDYLEARDQLYWEKGYTLAAADEKSSMPLFLADLASAIFCCGKSLNLLRSCSPQHFLTGASDVDVPRLMISYLPLDLRMVNVQCEVYISRMRQIARQLTVSRAEQKQRLEAARKELLETARRMAAAEITRLQGILDDRKKKADEKKRKELKMLKDQMTADLQRRADEATAAKEADKAYMARLTRQEEAMTEKEIQLEQQARDELIAYYTQLGEEAVRREQRALWRIRRARLETSRRELLEQENKKWQTEMEEMRQAQTLLKKMPGDDALPAWVQEHEGSTEPIEVSGASQWQRPSDTAQEERDWSLPRWAERRDQTTANTGTDAFDVDKKMPASETEGGASKTKDGTSKKEGGTTAAVGDGTSKMEDGGTKMTAADAQRAASSEESAGRKRDEEIDSDTKNMPEWARRVLTQDGGSLETLTVNGEEEGDGGVVDDDVKIKSGGVSTLTAPSLQDGAVKMHTLPAETPVMSAGTPVASGNGDACRAQKEEENIFEDKLSEHPQTSVDEKAAQKPDATDTSAPVHPRKVKTGIHMVEGVSVNLESLEQPARPQVQVLQSMHATKESESVEEKKSHVKLVSGMSATKQTESDDTYVPHTKQVQSMYATKETEEAMQKPHLKTVAGQHANIQSQQEVKAIPKLSSSSKYNLSTETQPTEWAIKKPSLFGHVSQLSKMDYEFQAPKLRRQKDIHANLESDFREFTVKPNIRMHKTRSATAESTEQAEKPKIKISKEFHASVESEYKDWEGIRRKRFQEQNVYGHSSDSTVEKLLYGGKFGIAPGTIKKEEEDEVKQIVPPFTMDALDLMSDDLEPFDDIADRLKSPLNMDLVSGLRGMVQGGFGFNPGEATLSEEDTEALTFTPLPVLLKQALTTPLNAQISLVNETTVTFFLVDLKMDQHFETLHRYLFLADGDFAENLTDILMEKLSSCHLPHEMLTPWFLNSALIRALQLSSSAVPQFADNLSFALHYVPEFFRHNSHDALDCLDLRYKVTWPVNIVLTEECMTNYGRVFTFMMQLKRVAWTLKDCWHKLKRDAIVKKAKDSAQLRQLQLHRHEMQHFVRVMQGYIANQIIQVTWKELQDSLDRDVHSLDDLRKVHRTYLTKAIFRCLLNKKAAPIMKIIQDIFHLILKFAHQLGSATWGHDPSTGDITHPNFNAMVASFKAFKEYFAFLFKVVNKLASHGYQPHLQVLLLHLNFNNYYTQ